MRNSAAYFEEKGKRRAKSTFVVLRCVGKDDSLEMEDFLDDNPRFDIGEAESVDRARTILKKAELPFRQLHWSFVDILSDTPAAKTNNFGLDVLRLITSYVQGDSPIHRIMQKGTLFWLVCHGKKTVPFKKKLSRLPAFPLFDFPSHLLRPVIATFHRLICDPPQTSKRQKRLRQHSLENAVRLHVSPSPPFQTPRSAFHCA